MKDLTHDQMAKICRLLADPEHADAVGALFRNYLEAVDAEDKTITLTEFAPVVGTANAVRVSRVDWDRSIAQLNDLREELACRMYGKPMPSRSMCDVPYNVDLYAHTRIPDLLYVRCSYKQGLATFKGHLIDGEVRWRDLRGREPSTAMLRAIEPELERHKAERVKHAEMVQKRDVIDDTLKQLQAYYLETIEASHFDYAKRISLAIKYVRIPAGAWTLLKEEEALTAHVAAIYSDISDAATHVKMSAELYREAREERKDYRERIKRLSQQLESFVPKLKEPPAPPERKTCVGCLYINEPAQLEPCSDCSRRGALSVSFSPRKDNWCPARSPVR